MSKDCILFIFKKTEQSETILRNSAVRYSVFCGSLFSPAAGCQSGQFNLTFPSSFFSTFRIRTSDFLYHLPNISPSFIHSPARFAPVCAVQPLRRASNFLGREFPHNSAFCPFS
jgi:hypothetical protein